MSASIAAAAVSENGFSYPIWVSPHHTDYAGIVWHGSYVAWLEEARVAYLRSRQIEFADLVSMGCDLPVVNLTMRYHRSLKMGMNAIVKVRFLPVQKVRLICDCQIQSLDGVELYVTAQVTLVPIDRTTGKILRQMPPSLQLALSDSQP